MIPSANRFSMNPTNIDIPRSVFKRPFNRYQTQKACLITPFYLDEVLPSDTVSINTTAFTRMSKPILPTMQPLWQDIYYFFVPMSMVFTSSKQFFGENDSAAWTRSYDVQLPHLTGTSITGMVNEGVYLSGSLLDHLGVHLGVDDGDTTQTVSGVAHMQGLEGINTLPIRAYLAVCDSWFRDENYGTPIAYNKGLSGDSDYYFYENNTQHFIHRSGLVTAYQLPDFFTTVLPAPQKGPDVIPLGTAFEGGSSIKVPVVAGDEHMKSGSTGFYPALFRDVASGNTAGNVSANAMLGTGTQGNLITRSLVEGSTQTSGIGVTNLWANLSANIFASVNQIRTAFALQRFFEKDARGGTRYQEKILAHFGCHSQDLLMGRPEYLGGDRFMLNMDTVLTTADTSDGSTGEFAGYSKTRESIAGFTKSFTQHGYIIGVSVIRPQASYFQGIPPMFLREDQYDFYWPSFANIGELEVKKKTVFADCDLASGMDQVFGYNEPYGEYRYKPDEICGDLRPTAASPLKGYTYARKFGNALLANAANVRTANFGDVTQNLAVPSGVQFITMYHVDAKWRRPMPVYSIPGLVDHH